MNSSKPMRSKLPTLIFLALCGYGLFRWWPDRQMPARLAAVVPAPLATLVAAPPRLALVPDLPDETEPPAGDIYPPVPETPAPPESTAPTPTPISSSEGAELTPFNLPLALPGPAQVVVRRDARIADLEAKIKQFASFERYRALAAQHLRLGNNAEAARVFRVQAALYRAKGLNDAAQILENRAAQNESSARIFAARADAPSHFSDAPLEPARGCYLGAFIDLDESLPTQFQGDNWQSHRLPSEFKRSVGIGLGSVFTYVKYGNFPRRWLEMCKSQGVIPQIAWEPDDLSQVRDDQFLRDCARFLRALDWPVWIRFAGEMNGAWTPYHGNPKLYREKFRLVNRVLHSGGARVATIWCVNAVPLENIGDYYPGDDGCDWVGVNFYSAPFLDNDRQREAFRDSPLALLDPIYKRFSARKPIAICEYAASHQAKLDLKMRPDFAIEKMSLLYGALPLLYPRVKMISWFDNNNLIHAEPGRQLNNYRLTQVPAIETAFRQLAATPYFLKSYPPGPASAPALRELKPGELLRRGERIWIWATSAIARPALYLQHNGRTIYAGKRYGKHVVDVPPGDGSVTLLLYNGARCVYRREVRVAGG